MINKHYREFGLCCLLALFLSACNTTQVKTGEQDENRLPTVIPEDLLLDVGIGIFKPGVDGLSADEEGIYPQVRAAESRYMPVQLMETLQRTAHWGAVRVIPERQSEADLWVDAEILKSNGQVLELSVSVEDASAKKWYTRKYTEEADKTTYGGSTRNKQQPFQGIYTRIADDMYNYMRQLPISELRQLRTISELKFARRFAPDVFADYLGQDDRGRLVLKRLPAENDPTLLRIRRIRERDNVFVDTLQGYYGAFSRRMAGPYGEWRKQSFEEQESLDRLNNEKWTSGLLGAAAVLIGVLAQDSRSSAGRTAGAITIGAGAMGIKNAFDKNEESKIHVQALEELGESLNAEIEPHTIEVDERTATLTGSVNQQYSQWQQILGEMYRNETGQLDPIPH